MTLTASALASAITAAQGPAQDTSIQDAANLKLAQGIIPYLIANSLVAVTIPPAAIATAGSASAQVGPPAPVPLSGTIS